MSFSSTNFSFTSVFFLLSFHVNLELWETPPTISRGECVRLKNFVSNSQITDNTIEHCGVYDYQFNEGKKNGEGIYIGTSNKQVTKQITVVVRSTHSVCLRCHLRDQNPRNDALN